MNGRLFGRRAVTCGIVAMFAGGLLAESADAMLFYSEDGNANGLFSINTTTGLASQVGAGITGVTSDTVGLAPSASPTQLWGSKPFDLLNINADGSGSVNIGGGNGVEGLGFDPNTGTLYYAINRAFGTQNTTTGALSPLAGPGSDVEGLAFGNGGIYGLDVNSDLLFYNIGANTWSLIGNTGLTAGVNKGLAYDPAANVLYSISGQDSGVYRTDPNDGSTVLIGDTGRQVARGGLAFVAADRVVVPEPVSAGLGLMGLGGLAGVLRRRGG